MKTKFKTTRNGLLWGAAKCQTKDEFDMVLHGMEVINQNAAAYVGGIPGDMGPLALHRQTVRSCHIQHGGVDE